MFKYLLLIVSIWQYFQLGQWLFCCGAIASAVDNTNAIASAIDFDFANDIAIAIDFANAIASPITIADLQRISGCIGQYKQALPLRLPFFQHWLQNPEVKKEAFPLRCQTWFAHCVLRPRAFPYLIW